MFVTDDEVSSAILTLIENQKMIVEGAGATTVATVMFGKFNLKGKCVVAVVWVVILMLQVCLASFTEAF